MVTEFVVNIVSTIECLESLASEMTYRVSIATYNYLRRYVACITVVIGFVWHFSKRVA